MIGRLQMTSECRHVLPISMKTRPKLLVRPVDLQNSDDLIPAISYKTLGMGIFLLPPGANSGSATV